MAIRDLYEELETVNKVIASLELFQRTGTLLTHQHRGRKSMDEQERKLVSERMKKYWIGRHDEASSSYGVSKK